jgi:hypothetical protein
VPLQLLVVFRAVTQTTLELRVLKDEGSDSQQHAPVQALSYDWKMNDTRSI